MQKTLYLTVVLFSLAFSLFAQAPANRLGIGRISVNQNSVAFTYAGRIWLVGRGGGAARRLTNTQFEETNPLFSPDGTQIAFSQLNGNDWDIYVMPADGSGTARRVTMMPEDDLLTSWTPDGKEVVFETTRDEENVTRLYKVAITGESLASPLPLPQGFQGSVSPDGNRIAYNPRLGFGEWRYYRGGAEAPIWIADLRSGALEKLPKGNYNDRSPVWIDDKIYFNSDRTGIFNLFEYDQKTKKTRQLTNFDGQGVRAFSASKGVIAYVQSGQIHVSEEGTDKVLNISVAPDVSELQPRTVNASRYVEQYLPSANGDKIAVGSRGEVLVFDTATGNYKNVTNSSKSVERYPAIAPNGKSVAYFSDESGEYQLHIRSLDDDSVRKYNIEKVPSFYWAVGWSPDSKKLAFADRRLQLWMADAETGTMTKVDTSPYSAQYDWAVNFSPDSRYLTYAKRLNNRVGTIFIYDIAQKRTQQVTDGVTHTQTPVFDANGKYLYFASSLTAGMSEFNWGVLNDAFSQPLVVRRLHAMLLAKDTPSPLLPNNQPNPDAKVNEALPAVKIDFDGLASRVVNLPLPQRDYGQLGSGRPGRLTMQVAEWGKAPGDLNGRQQTQAVYSIDLAKSDGPQKVVDEIDAADFTRDGNKILYRKGRDFFLAATDTVAKPGEGKVDLSKMEIRVNPAEEWRQMFHESMRIMRDWFYDPNYHGQDLRALEQFYASFLPTTTRRSDLNRLIQQMLGSVSISHLRVSDGDAQPPAGPGNRIGLLGADYEIANGKYRFKKIYRSTGYASTNGTFAAPLDRPGLDVRDGDYLIEVNGKTVEATKNVLSYFVDTINRPTKIKVSQSADGSASREFTVYPAPGENRLRRANWAEENRKYVEKMSNGKLGYIFIENYDPDGITNAIRGITGYADKAGIIVDQRDNGGGITPDYLIEWLRRAPLYSYRFRGGEDIAVPVNPAPAVKVMLINENNGSAAETGAFMFKLAKVGSIVGKATYGAGIGPYFFTPRLADGGRVQLPNRAAYNPDGTSWGIENAGVQPDYDVDITPADVRAGRDPQLAKAVEVAMAQAAKTPGYQPKAPAFPVHPGRQEPIGETFQLPAPGSAFAIPAAKGEIAATNDNRYSDFVGRYDSPMGAVTFRQEGDKLVGDTGERLDFSPDPAVKDKFVAARGGISVTFERDGARKVTGAKIVIASGAEVMAKRVQ